MVKVGSKIKIVELTGCNDGLTLHKEYVVVELDNDPNFPGAVFVIDDHGVENVVFKKEFVNV